jgi:hypothetical protein
MADRSRYRSGSGRRSSRFHGRRSAGLERAKQHIREAEELSLVSSLSDSAVARSRSAARKRPDRSPLKPLLRPKMPIRYPSAIAVRSPTPQLQS